MQKINNFFKPLFLTRDGFIFLDRNILNKDNKIVFQKFETDIDIKSDEEAETELKNIDNYLKNNKLQIISTAYFKTTVYTGISNNEKDYDQYFILFIKSENKENLFPLGEVITDEKIAWQDRYILSDFIQGRLINDLHPEELLN